LNKIINIKEIIKTPIVLLLMLFYSSEALFKYFMFIDYPNYRVSGVVKIVVEIIMCYYILSSLSKYRTSVILLILLFTSFYILQISDIELKHFLLNLEIFNNYVFIILLFLFIKKKQEFFFNQERKIAKLFELFEYFILINSIIIIIGFIFQIEFFRTYYIGGDRFGYSGLFSKQSTAKYFYMIALAFFIYNRKFSIEKIISFIIIIIAAILTGTKATFLFVILLIPYLLLFYNFKYKKPMLIFLICLGGVVMIYSNTIISYVLLKSPTFAPIVQEKGIITALFSYRDVLFKEHFIDVLNKKWGITNYLFGGTGISKEYYRTGFAIIDLFMVFGVIGGVIYVLLYFKTVLLIKFNPKSIYLIVAFFSIISISGNFLPNASIAIYMLFLNIKFNETNCIK